MQTIRVPRTVPRFTPRSFQNGTLPESSWHAWDDTTGAFTPHLPETFSREHAEALCQELNNRLGGNIGEPHYRVADAAPETAEPVSL